MFTFKDYKAILQAKPGTLYQRNGPIWFEGFIGYLITHKEKGKGILRAELHFLTKFRRSLYQHEFYEFNKLYAEKNAVYLSL